MYRHSDLQKNELMLKIRQQSIQCAGNSRLKIFGHLDCASGKRMKKENRVFFRNEDEALSKGFRPCAHCMPEHYEIWKKEQCE
jgi:methylphosphotriester-DNA--protein-cysteine methyltransferase